MSFSKRVVPTLKNLFVLTILTAGVVLHAQSYQTSFAGEKFDSSKGPATVHGGVEVEASTGAVSINIPLGPGIGTRGLNFKPILWGHVAPTVNGSSKWNGVSGKYDHSFVSSLESPFSLSPGHLELALSNDSLGEEERNWLQPILPHPLPNYRLIRPVRGDQERG